MTCDPGHEHLIGDKEIFGSGFAADDAFQSVLLALKSGIISGMSRSKYQNGIGTFITVKYERKMSKTGTKRHITTRALMILFSVL